jgi:hypothetical protein
VGQPPRPVVSTVEIYVVLVLSTSWEASGLGLERQSAMEFADWCLFTTALRDVTLAGADHLIISITI